MRDGSSDREIVLAVLSGNAKAYGDIVHKYKNTVFFAIYSIVRNHHTAEDLSQDTFVDGYIKIKSLGEPYNVGAWLVKIAKNKSKNYLTRSAIRFESELNDDIFDVRTPEPEMLLIKRQEREMLTQALLKLPDLYRKTAVLFYFYNYSHEKIAEHLNIPQGTVKSRLSNARIKLKKELRYCL